MGSPASPALWLETSASGLPCIDESDADVLGVDAFVVTAWRSGAAHGSPTTQLGPSGDRGGRRRGLGRSVRRSCPMEELLEAAPGRTSLAVEPTDADVACYVVREARLLGMLERLWVRSPDLAILDAVREESPAARLLHSCVPTAQPQGAERHAAVLRERDIQGVTVPTDRVGAGLVALMHRFGRIVAAEGAEHPRMVRSAISAGVDIVSGPTARVLTDGPG